MECRLDILLRESKIIPSAASVEALKYAAEKLPYPCVMVKVGDINSIAKLVDYLHKRKKTVMLHIDSIKGISKDEAGIHYLKRIGVDSIITMKLQNIRMIKEEGILSILGTFLVDSSSLASTIQNIYSNKPDAVVAMPMTIPDVVYQKLLKSCTVPVMAGGWE
ncbi:MAG: glycerol-3-phosphate responsive antiterminator [Lachnospiraceae bacterium]|nr:glycerol-3-phosphate responsive antiterminator [Lachnospiraceae bacterium]